MTQPLFGSAVQVIIGLFVNTLAVFVAATILPGVMVASLTVALITAIVLGVVNTFIKPLLIVLTLPMTILTLGFFLLILNALLVLLVDWLVIGFEVRNFWWALLFSFVVSLVGSFLNSLQQS